MNLIKPSATKHESDIPEFDFSSAVTRHLKQRKEVLKYFKSVGESCFTSYSLDEECKYYDLLMQKGDNQMFGLEKRFVVHGDLSGSILQDINVLNNSEELVAAALATFSITRYEEHVDLNSFNTFIRLIDWYCGREQYHSRLSMKMFIGFIEKEVCSINKFSEN